MDKHQAAKYLGVSVRTLQRHTAAGKVSAKYLPGKQGHQAVYDRAELERFKRELAEVTSYVRPSVTPGVPVTPAGETTALAQRVQPFDVLQKLTAALEALKQPPDPTPALADLAHKLMLTLHEAALLSGLSRGFLREAIRGKKLKAQIIGKGWKVKRNDLDAFIHKL